MSLLFTCSAAPSKAPRGAPTSTRARHGADRGAGAVEYGSIIVLVAAIFAGVFLVVPPGISGPVEDALCRLFGETGCGEKDERDYAPDYCVREAESQHGGFSVDIGIVTIGKDYKFQKETLSDGSVIVTYAPKTEAGLITGAGFEIGKKGAADASARIDATAKGSVTPGESHIFKNEEEYKEYEDQLKDDVKDEVAKDLSPGYRAVRWGLDKTGVVDDPEPRDPEIRWVDVGVSAELDASAGVWMNNSSKGRHAKQDPKDWKMNLGADGNAKVEGKAGVAVWKDEPENTKTATTFTWSGEGSLGADLGPKRYGGSASWKGGTRIMRNEDGSLKNIRYTTTVSRSGTSGESGEVGKGNDGNKNKRKSNKNNVDKGGGASSTETNGEATTQSVQINFETPEEQEAGEALLRDRGLLPPTNTLTSLADPTMDAQEGGAINEKPGPDAPPWEQVMYEKGTAWQYKENFTSDEQSIGAKAKLGLAVGADVSWGMEERHTNDAQILGPPSGGQRNFIDYPKCVSKEGQGG